MKIKTGRQLEKAVREFTDREEPRASFWKKYHAVEAELGGEANAHVLTYYGIGGIGKTSLVKRLMREMDQQLTDPVYVYLDFSISPDIRRVLYSLKTKLAEKTDFTFPLLDLGLYVYAKKVGENADSPEVQQLTEKSPFLSLLLSVADNIPVLGLATKVLSLTDKSLTFIRNYLKMHSHELSRIEHMDPDTLYNHLPLLFALDMQHNMQNAKTPVVFFLDTYEQLVNEMSQTGDPLKNDEWIRGDDGLIQNIPGVLWVITGREKLKWLRFDPDWADALAQHLLGSLSQADSVQFLARAGIAGKELRDQLYSLTQGTPVFLDLCVDQYFRLIDRGETPTIDSFGANTYDLTERFIRYMGDAQKDQVYLLACLQSWTPALIDELAELILPNFSITTYEKTKEYSFVITLDEKHYHIQKTVGEVLLKSCPEVIRKRTGKALLDRFLGTVQRLELYTDRFADALLYVARGALLYYSDRDELHDFYVNHIDDALDAFVDAGQFRQAKLVLDLLTDATSTQHADKLYAALRYANSRFARLSGDYSTSLNHAEEALNVYRSSVGENHLYTIKALGNLAIVLGALGRHQEALDKKREVLEKRLRLLGEDHLSTGWAMHNLAVTLGILGNHREAYDLQIVVLEKRRRILGENHPDTIWAMLNLAVTLGALGRHSDALSLQQEVLEKRSLLLGEDHPDTIWAMYHLAMTLIALGDRQKAIAMMQSILEKRQHILGEKHPDTVMAKNYLENLLGGPSWQP